MTSAARLYPVDHGIPLPPNPRLGGGRTRQRYPFKLMEIGDSFLVPYGEEAPEIVRNRAAVSCSKTSADTGYRFELRTLADGIRIWRTK